jgi:hypothetical protein
VSTTAAPAETRGDISRQWIKANLFGGIAFNAVAVASEFAIQFAGITYGQATSIELIALGTGYIAAYSASLILLGYLTGVVLRQKLPQFPLQAWLVLFGLLGLFVGALMMVPWLWEGAEDDLTFGGPEFPAFLGILGVSVGALAGALQALVLRKSTEGLWAWIVYSALSGISWLAVVPIMLYGPRTGVGRDVLWALGGVCITVAAALIMLPAVHRLRPR